jgi:hypothetical protein
MGLPRQLVVAITLALAFPAASLAQIRVLMFGGFSAAYHELLPQFENTTGITVTTTTGASQGDGPNTIRAQLRRGVMGPVHRPWIPESAEFHQCHLFPLWGPQPRPITTKNPEEPKFPGRGKSFGRNRGACCILTRAGRPKRKS